MKLPAILLIAASTLALSGAAHAGTYRFCGSDGPYGDIAEHVAEFSTERVKIEAVNDSAGTSESFRRLLLPKTDPKSCDAIIGQPDGYLYFRRHPDFFGGKGGDVSAIQQRVTFHGEKVQIVCDKKLNLKNIYNAAGDNKVKIALGPDGSGSWLWWQSAIEANKAYDKLQVSQAGGEDALSQIVNNLASCFVRVSGIPDPVIEKADKDWGAGLQMVQAYDDAFVTTKGPDDNPVYSWAKVERGSYPKILDWASYVWTVEEPAGGYVNTRKVAPEDMSAVVGAMKNASKYAKATYGE